ncbi:MAG: SCO family protein [Acidimicrobiales bacterium]
MAGWTVAALVLAAFAFTVWQPIQVLPRIELAPGYALVDQRGQQYTSESGRGSVTLYNFAPLDCGDRCAGTDATLAEVLSRVPAEVDLGDVGFRVVTIALDPVGDDPSALAAAAARSGADGERWRWIGGGEDRVRTLVGSGFHRSIGTGPDGETAADPGFVLVDGNGVIRGDYRYRTTAPEVDRLVGNLKVLAGEIRNAHGAATVAYEAAHLFLCYP